MSHLSMYLFTRLDALNCLFFIASASSTIIFFISFIVCIAEDAMVKYKKSFIIAIPFLLFFIAGVVFIPTQKEAAAIFLVPKIVNNERILNVDDGSFSLVELKLKEWTFDLIEESANE